MPLLNCIIDLSHHNQVASFADAKADGIVGVIHKATQGVSFVDAKYGSRRARALADGLLWGAYHFGTRGNAAAQADHFLETTNPTGDDLLVLDFEFNSESGTMRLAEAEEFVTIINSRTGRFPVLYTGQSFIREKLGSNTATVLSKCDLWIARYSENRPQPPLAWNDFRIWQYTDGNLGPQPHQVRGIGRCDRDKFNGTEEELLAMWRR